MAQQRAYGNVYNEMISHYLQGGTVAGYRGQTQMGDINLASNPLHLQQHGFGNREKFAEPGDHSHASLHPISITHIHTIKHAKMNDCHTFKHREMNNLYMQTLNDTLTF